MRVDRRFFAEPRRPIAVVVWTAAVMLVVVGVVAAVSSWALARAAARDDAASSAERISDFLVGPLLARSLAGDVAAGDELRRAVRSRMSDGSIRQITVWTADGTVVFSSEPRLNGLRAVENAELVEAARGHLVADIATSDDFHTLVPDLPVVEVYVPMRAVPGLVLEAYHDAGAVQRHTTALAIPIVVVSVLPLVLLQLLQSPVLLSLVRRVRRASHERAALLERALSASERERRDIAAGLHDTVVQDLAGAGYALASLEADVSERRRHLLDEVNRTLSGTIDALRKLMLDLHPPDLTWDGFPEVVERLADPLRTRGVTVDVTVTGDGVPDQATTVALYRIVRECLTNVAKHARAEEVRVAVTATERGVRLLVVDDGIGIAPERLGVARPGHLGTTLVRDCVDGLGGSLRWTPGIDGGTTVEVELPATAGVPSS